MPMKNDLKKLPKDGQSLTFEEQMQRLEEIVEILDEMIALYEEGMQRSQDCRKYLEQAEQKITLIQNPEI